MTYLQGHKKSGLKVGDTVIVKRSCADCEGGWYNSWSAGMDKIIECERKIVCDNKTRGFRLSNTLYDFPYFVLEKVK